MLTKCPQLHQNIVFFAFLNWSERYLSGACVTSYIFISILKWSYTYNTNDCNPCVLNRETGTRDTDTAINRVMLSIQNGDAQKIPFFRLFVFSCALIATARVATRTTGCFLNGAKQSLLNKTTSLPYKPSLFQSALRFWSLRILTGSRAAWFPGTKQERKNISKSLLTASIE